MIGDYSYDFATDTFDNTWIFSPNSPHLNTSSGEYRCADCHSCCLRDGQARDPERPNQKIGTPVVWKLPWSVGQVLASCKSCAFLKSSLLFIP